MKTCCLFFIFCKTILALYFNFICFTFLTGASLVSLFSPPLLKSLKYMILTKILYSIFTTPESVSEVKNV